MQPKIELDQWQKDILAHEGHFLLCTGRQVGKTLTFAIKAAQYMIKHPNARIIVVSLTEDQAQLIIVMVLDYFERNYKKEIEVKKKQPTKNKILLKNGSQILARPVGNTGDAVRGFTGDVLIVDEASKMPEHMWTAAKPTLLTTGGQLWICSTPFGKKGYFYECFLNKNKRFKVFHISSEEVIHNRPITPAWTQQRKEESIAFLEEEKRDNSKLVYAQEYLGKFIDELRQLFSDKWIDMVCTLERTNQAKGDYYLGCDLARMGGDELSFEIIKKIDKDNFIHVENITDKYRLTTWAYDMIIDLERTWNFQKEGIGIDAGSGALGVGILDFLLRNEETKYKVIAMNNLQRIMDKEGDKKRALLKEDMYMNLLSLGEKGKVKLLNEDNVRLSLKSVQYEYVVKEDRVSQFKIFGRYTHIAEGLVRALWLANRGNQLGFWIR